MLSTPFPNAAQPELEVVEVLFQLFVEPRLLSNVQRSDCQSLPNDRGAMEGAERLLPDRFWIDAAKAQEPSLRSRPLEPIYRYVVVYI